MKSFVVPIYRARVFVSTDRDESAQLWPNAKDWNGVCGSTSKGFFIGVHDGKLSTLVHECVHLANFILADRGVIVDKDNDEAQAYLVEYLWETICKKLPSLRL